jgi:Flp pilus assembly protein TadG
MATSTSNRTASGLTRASDLAALALALLQTSLHQLLDQRHQQRFVQGELHSTLLDREVLPVQITEGSFFLM